MYENVECSNNHENAYCEYVDENGAHYVCPDCGFEWVDESVQPEQESEEEPE
ncbi:MAG: hypothetical protein R2780_01645 [Crocinitomicaceae bacterium]